MLIIGNLIKGNSNEPFVPNEIHVEEREKKKEKKILCLGGGGGRLTTTKVGWY